MDESTATPGAEHGRDERALGRRALIKKAAAAGAVAWTAPVIVGSLASPAAAATAPPGMNRVQISASTCAPQAANGTCLPTSWGAATITLPSVCIASTTNNFNDCNGFLGAESFRVAGGCSCSFVSARASTTDGGCIAPTTLGPTSVTFPARFLPVYSQFKFVLSCG